MDIKQFQRLYHASNSNIKWKTIVLNKCKKEATDICIYCKYQNTIPSFTTYRVSHKNDITSLSFQLCKNPFD